MNQTFLDNLQLVPGFYPLASLLTGAALYFLYRLFIHMRCRSRPAQAFLTLGMCLMTAALFLRLTVWTEPATGTPPPPATDIRPATERPVKSPQSLSVTPPTQASPAPPAENRLRPTEKMQKALAAAWDYVLSNLPAIYATGIALLLLYMAAQIGQLHRIRRKSTLQGHRGCIRVYQSPCNAPFSYSYNIFLPGGMEDGQQDFVLAHEECHIWHRHFHKLLFLQCLTIANWFNPFAYLLFRALKELQEMEVDRDVLDNGFDREQYQISLVLACTTHKEWIWARSNYNYSSLKERILFMNRHIQNSKSRLLALAATLCLTGFTLAVTTQAMEKPGKAAEKTAEETPAAIPATTEATPEAIAKATADAAQPTTLPTPPKATPGSAATPANVKKQKNYDSRGCWTMLFIGDSAYQHHQVAPAITHYKFFGKKASLTLTVNWPVREDVMRIGGATGDYDPFSLTTVREGGQMHPRQWINADQLDDTWKDTYHISPFIPSDWKTERWKRCTPPEIVSQIVRVYKECTRRKDKLKGVWKHVWKQEIDRPTYLLFGKTHFLALTFDPKEPKNLFYTFAGYTGTFAFDGDDTLTEGDKTIYIEWDGEDSFTGDVYPFPATYTRVDMPEDLRKVFEGCGILNY